MAEATKPEGSDREPSVTSMIQDAFGISSQAKGSRSTGRSYQMDMEQAEAMRKDMKGSKREMAAPEQKTADMKEQDILLALKGLDESDILREKGNLQEAFEISNLSLEILIKLLRSPVSVVPTIDRGAIGARVQVALTDAENLKKRLSSAPQNASSPPSRNAPQQTQSKEISGKKSISQSLAAAIRRVSGVSPTKTAATAKTAQPARTTQPTRPTQPAGQRTSSSRTLTRGPSVSSNMGSRNPSSRSLGDSKPRQSPSGLSPRSNASISPKSNVSHQTQTTSPFRSNDPLVQMVKTDFYVAQSKLQNTSWDDIAGLDTAKQSLQEAAILPMMRPDLFTGLRKPQNILLYGPPGTGKTMLVRAVAKESNCLLFICSASAVTSKWQGEGEKIVRALFNVARAAAPSIVFIDEMDALLSNRKSDGEHEASRRLKTEFMTNMDGVKGHEETINADGEIKHTLVIGCTNCPWDVDSAVMRRFPKRIYIPLPDPITRKALLLKLLDKAGKHKISAAEFKAIIKRTQGFSGSDIASIAAEASFGPLRSLGGMDAIRGVQVQDIRPISAKDFDSAITQATKSVSADLLQRYDDWKKQQAAG